MCASVATEVTGSRSVQTTGEVASMTASRAIEAASTRAFDAASKTATRPVEGPVMRVLATQPVEALGAGTATQPVEAPGADPECSANQYW